jgi:predicted DNA-binding transcriptional regulator
MLWAIPDTPGSASRSLFAMSRSARASKATGGPTSRPPAKRRETPAAPAAGGTWTFLTNHAHVLILLSQNPSTVLREVAFRVGITERAVQRIIADLERDGFIEREKVGRQNSYRIRPSKPLRHPIEAHRSIGDLIDLI